MSDKTFSQVLNFTRASTGTYFDSAGVLQTAAVDQPRFDHDPVTGEALGLLVEESRTNLLTYSEAFDNADWIKLSSSTVDTNVANAPDGLVTADRINFGADSTSRVEHVAAITDGSTYTFSAWLKAEAGSTLVHFGLSGSNSDLFDLVQVSDEWQRFEFTGVLSGTNAYPRFQNADSSPSSVLAWGAQLEQGNYPTSYIPTTTAQVTRSADNCVRPLGSEFNASEGALRITANAPIGTVLSRLGTFEVVSDFDGEKTYAESYTSDPSATELEILPDGSGTMKSLKYENGAL